VETGAISTASPGRESCSNSHLADSFMSFPILRPHAIYLWPVATLKRPKIESPLWGERGTHSTTNGGANSSTKAHAFSSSVLIVTFHPSLAQMRAFANAMSELSRFIRTT
jgi:hypothetical protein